MRKSYLWLECLGLFIGLPLLINALGQRWLFIAMLWSATLAIYLKLKTLPSFSHGLEWNFGAVRRNFGRVIILFALAAPLIALLTYYLRPDLFLSLPRTRPQLWLVIMVIYPVLSVWPQEMIYRSWIYHRYQPLWQKPMSYILLSALMFGFAHVIFRNPLAVVLSALGGAVFAMTYLRTKSLALCCLEHALYGCLIFTIGLGYYFYSGTHFH